MAIEKLPRSIFQRIFGIPATNKPANADCWRVEGDRIVLDAARVPELSRPWGAVRLEGGGCPERVLIIRGEDERLHAYRNRCGHVGRRLDPVPQTGTIQCCSINAATYDYDCQKLGGPGRGAVIQYEVEEADDQIRIKLEARS